MEAEKIVGHKTMLDGSHEPIYESEAIAIIAACDAAKAKREQDMPTEKDAIHAMWSAYHRLEELGWRDAIYCPKDGSAFDVIEPGSTGIHKCHYQGEWPKGTWWISDEHDMYPSRPVLYKVQKC